MFFPVHVYVQAVDSTNIDKDNLERQHEVCLSAINFNPIYMFCFS